MTKSYSNGLDISANLRKRDFADKKLFKLWNL